MMIFIEYLAVSPEQVFIHEKITKANVSSITVMMQKQTNISKTVS